MFNISIKEIRYADIPLLEKIENICLNKEIIKVLTEHYNFLKALNGKRYFSYPYSWPEKIYIYISLQDIQKYNFPIEIFQPYYPNSICNKIYLLDQDYNTLKKDPFLLSKIYLFLSEYELEKVAKDVITDIEYVKRFLKEINSQSHHTHIDDEKITGLLSQTDIYKSIEQNEEILSYLASIKIILNPQKQIISIINNLEKENNLENAYNSISTGMTIMEEEKIFVDSPVLDNDKLAKIYKNIEAMPTPSSRIYYSTKKRTLSVFIKMVLYLCGAGIVKISDDDIKNKKGIVKKIIKHMFNTPILNNALNIITPIVNELDANHVKRANIKTLIKIKDDIKDKEISEFLDTIEKITKIKYCENIGGTLNSFYIEFNDQLQDIIESFDMKKALSDNDYFEAISNTLMLIRKPNMSYTDPVSNTQIQNILKIYQKEQ